MGNKKIFLITVDTEADNQWDVNHPITTENAKFLPRFQELCEKYDFKPVWLTDYEMACDPFFVTYMKPRQDAGLCEIGMHLHAWHTPPEYSLQKVNNQREYLIEYPPEIMEQKIRTMTKLITEKFGLAPTSHRSGRWTMNTQYFSLLAKYGYLTDCSVTPHVDWSHLCGATGIPGSNYTNEPETPHYITKEILEVPMTIRKVRFFNREYISSFHNFLGETKRLRAGRYQWLRPDKTLSTKGLLQLAKQLSRNDQYIMFMIHSSELMPGGSPSFTSNESIEALYLLMDCLFGKIKDLGYVGQTLRKFTQDFGQNQED